MFALALLHALAVAEGPADAGVGFTDIFAGLTTAAFALRGGGAIAVSAVGGVKVDGVDVEVEGGGGNRVRFGVWGEASKGDAVGDGGLLFTGYVHYVEGEELTGNVGEGYVEIDWKLLDCLCQYGCAQAPC